MANDSEPATDVRDGSKADEDEQQAPAGAWQAEPAEDEEVEMIDDENEVNGDVVDHEEESSGSIEYIAEINQETDNNNEIAEMIAGGDAGAEDDEEEEEDGLGVIANANGISLGEASESNDVQDEEEEEEDASGPNKQQFSDVITLEDEDDEDDVAIEEDNALQLEDDEDDDDEQANESTIDGGVVGKPKVTIMKNGTSSTGTSLLASSAVKSLLNNGGSATPTANGVKNGTTDKKVVGNLSKMVPNGNKMTEEITIVDDDDEDEDDEDEDAMEDDEEEAQDLSNKANGTNDDKAKDDVSSEDLIPKLDERLLGFPGIFEGVITIGECMALRKSRSDIDVDKDVSILDCPSQVMPLLIKKANVFPPKLKIEAKPDENSKPATAAGHNNSKNMLTIADFYSSSIGKFLLGVGLSRVKQWYHKDAINKVKKQIRKEGEAEDLMEDLRKQQEYFNVCRSANSSYLFPAEKCEQCDFRSEFKVVLNNHLNYPHTSASRKEFRCNYCQFSTRDSKVIVQHVHELHERKCLIELPPQLYECPICTYESGVKSKAATHIAKCLKFFMPEKLQATKDEYFPTITPKPITKEDIKIYEATLHALRCAALNPAQKVPTLSGLPPGLQQQMLLTQQQQQALAAGGGGGSRKRQSQLQSIAPKRQSMNNYVFNQMNLKNISPQLYQMLSNTPSLLQNPAINNALANLSSGTLNLLKNPQLLSKIQEQQAAAAAAAAGNKASGSSMARLPKGMSASLMSSKASASGSGIALGAPASNAGSKGDPNARGSFVMCEICDGYIKDLDQLRSHMHWIHKVRIHPKMLASRPPLNCQKCQWRFFTDQGLERHLLGSHGLVTSNMQEMVNTNQDAGRCTICGRVFNNKLVTHMNQVHKISLKPAHLSYKCTVCSATFNLYRLFESHVYMVHSGSVKRGNNSQDADSAGGPRKRMATDALVANGN